MKLKIFHHVPGEEDPEVRESIWQRLFLLERKQAELARRLQQIEMKSGIYQR